VFFASENGLIAFGLIVLGSVFSAVLANLRDQEDSKDEKDILESQLNDYIKQVDVVHSPEPHQSINWEPLVVDNGKKVVVDTSGSSSYSIGGSDSSSDYESSLTSSNPFDFLEFPIQCDQQASALLETNANRNPANALAPALTQSLQDNDNSWDFSVSSSLSSADESHHGANPGLPSISIMAPILSDNHNPVASFIDDESSLLEDISISSLFSFEDRGD
jgi:hypothetical protein